MAHSPFLLLLSLTLIAFLKPSVAVLSAVKRDLSAVEPLEVFVGFPQHGDDPFTNPFHLELSRSQPVFDIALEDVYNKYKYLPQDSIKIAFHDTNLSDSTGPNEVISAYCKDKLDAIFGFANVYGLATVARMSPLWNRGVPVFTTIGQADQLDDKSQFKLLTRMSGTYRNIGKAMQRVIDDLRWKTVAFFLDDPSVTSKKVGRSNCYFQLIAIKNLLNELRPDHYKFDHKIFDEATETDLKQVVSEVSKIANIIILCASPDTVREIMLAADQLGMVESGEYVFINIDVSTGSHAPQPWKRSNDTDAKNYQARQAYRALKTISLRRSTKSEYKEFEKRVKERAEEKYNYRQLMGKDYEMNNFISAFYTRRYSLQ